MITLLGAWPAVAAPADRPAQAKEAYERGTRAYTLGRFDQAIEAFSRAYELDPAPILLYNIAQSHWKSGNNERAVFFYRRYLEAHPKAENRDRIEARIEELEEAAKSPPPEKAAQKPAEAPPLTTMPAKSPEPPVALLDRQVPSRDGQDARPIYRRPWFWGVVGGVAVAAAATVLLVRRGEQPYECPFNDCPTVPVK